MESLRLESSDMPSILVTPMEEHLPVHISFSQPISSAGPLLSDSAPWHPEAGSDAAEHVKTEHAKTEHAKTEHVKAEHVKTEHDKNEHAHHPAHTKPATEQVKPDLATRRAEVPAKASGVSTPMPSLRRPPALRLDLNSGAADHHDAKQVSAVTPQTARRQHAHRSNHPQGSSVTPLALSIDNVFDYLERLPGRGTQRSRLPWREPPMTKAQLPFNAYCAPPVVSLSMNATKDLVLVSLTCSSKGACIYYTLNGCEPNKNSFKYNVRGPFLLRNACVVRARYDYSVWIYCLLTFV